MLYIRYMYNVLTKVKINSYTTQFRSNRNLKLYLTHKIGLVGVFDLYMTHKLVLITIFDAYMTKNLA